MDTLEEIKAGMRTWTDDQMQREAEECYKVLYMRAATREDKDETRLILQAIDEIKKERAAARVRQEDLQQEKEQAAEELAAIIEQAGRKAADERQARMIARAMQINGESAAAAQTDKAPAGHPYKMSTEQYSRIIKYLQPNYAKAAFSNDEKTIYKYLCGKGGKAKAQRLICRIYDEHLQSNYRNEKSNEHVTWIEWRDMFANAYGVKLTAKHAHAAQQGYK